MNLTESLEIKEGGTLKTTGAIKVVSTEDIAPEEMISFRTTISPMDILCRRSRTAVESITTR